MTLGALRSNHIGFEPESTFCHYDVRQATNGTLGQVAGLQRDAVGSIYGRRMSSRSCL